MSQGILLVTGSNGFLGQAVIESASRFYRCIASDWIETEDENDKATFLRLDLRDRAAVFAALETVRPTHVVHCGAISHPAHGSDDNLQTFDINVGGTVSLLEAARRIGVARFVFVSSAAVYEGYAGTGCVDESVRLEPRSIYGASKVAAEALVATYAKTDAIPAVILRPCSIYGARRRTFSVPAYLVAASLDGLSASVIDSGHDIDFVHVDDVVRAIMLSLENRTAVGRVYNIASGTRTSYATLVDVVRQIVPQAQISLISGAADLAPEPGFAVERALNDLGFSCRIRLTEGLTEMARTLSCSTSLRQQAIRATFDPQTPIRDLSSHSIQQNEA